MANEIETEPAKACPKCGETMELVHFVNGGPSMVVHHGPPPEGLLSQLAQAVAGSPVLTDSGEPVLFSFGWCNQVPGMHCKNCRQITISYRP